jgi:DNA-binding response OmpR family regulator
MGRILVVDDDADLRAVAKAVLSSAQHEVSLAENAFEAFALLEQYTYDVIISDANMPKINGFEFIRRLRQSSKYGQVPIALLTARRDREDIEKALAIGVNDYIVKPLDPLIFLKKIETLIQKAARPETAEALFNETEQPANIVISLKTSILTISEIGMTVQTNYPLVESEKIQMEAPIFKQIGIQTPVMRVFAVEPSPAIGFWIARLQFVGASDTTLQKIRAWVNQRLLKANRHAS